MSELENPQEPVGTRHSEVSVEQHVEPGMHCLDVAYFAFYPSVRLYPDVGSSSGFKSDLTVSNTYDLSAAVCREATTVNLHVTGDRDIPFNPNCLECAKGRSSFSREDTKVTEKRFQFRLILHFSTQQVRSLQTNFQVL